VGCVAKNHSSAGRVRPLHASVTLRMEFWRYFPLHVSQMSRGQAERTTRRINGITFRNSFLGWRLDSRQRWRAGGRISRQGQGGTNMEDLLPVRCRFLLYSGGVTDTASSWWWWLSARSDTTFNGGVHGQPAWSVISASRNAVIAITSLPRSRMALDGSNTRTPPNTAGRSGLLRPGRFPVHHLAQAP